jgi:hypothetical protein
VCDENKEKQLGIKIQKVHERDVDGKNALNIFSSDSYFNSKCSSIVHYSWGVWNMIKCYE